MTQQRPEVIKRIDGQDEAPIKTLVEEIRRKDEEIKILREIITKHVSDAKQLEEIKRELDEKQLEINKLTDELIKERAKRVANAKPLVAEITSEQVTSSILAVSGSVQFCLTDYSERVAYMKKDGAPASGDADVVIRLASTPTGTAFDVRTTSGLEASPGTRLCIEDALKRVAYPKGSETLDLRVTIAWQSSKLAMAANVVGQRAPGGSTLLDL
jgi:hypothetical protein